MSEVVVSGVFALLAALIAAGSVFVARRDERKAALDELEMMGRIRELELDNADRMVRELSEVIEYRVNRVYQNYRLGVQRIAFGVASVGIIAWYLSIGARAALGEEVAFATQMLELLRTVGNTSIVLMILGSTALALAIAIPAAIASGRLLRRQIERREGATSGKPRRSAHGASSPERSEEA